MKKTLQDIQNDVSMPKSMLIRLTDDLIALGLDKRARQLENIIGKLEDWQNK